MQEYKVLKKFGDYKKGDVFIPEESMAMDDLNLLIEEGKIAIVTEDSKEDETEKSSGKTSVIVTWGQGTREYSKAIHGPDFMKLAKQFAEKFDGVIS